MIFRYHHQVGYMQSDKHLSMSLRQLAQKLSITPQSVKEIEEREKNATISIKVLKTSSFSIGYEICLWIHPKRKDT